MFDDTAMFDDEPLGPRDGGPPRLTEASLSTLVRRCAAIWSAAAVVGILVVAAVAMNPETFLWPAATPGSLQYQVALGMLVATAAMVVIAAFGAASEVERRIRLHLWGGSEDIWPGVVPALVGMALMLTSPTWDAIGQVWVANDADAVPSGLPGEFALRLAPVVLLGLSEWLARTAIAAQPLIVLRKQDRESRNGTGVPVAGSGLTDESGLGAATAASEGPTTPGW